MAFGPMAELELLDTLIGDADQLLTKLKASAKESQESNAVRAERNAELRARMGDMKKNMSASLGKVMSKMMGILGQDAKDILTEEQVNRLLKATFEKFDVNGSNELENSEFRQA